MFQRDRPPWHLRVPTVDRLAVGVLALLLQGCAPEPALGPGLAVARSCAAGPAQAALGRPYTPELAQRAGAASGAGLVRRLTPQTQVTLEYRADRLNLDTDAAGNVTRVHCG